MFGCFPQPWHSGKGAYGGVTKWDIEMMQQQAYLKGKGKASSMGKGKNGKGENNKGKNTKGKNNGGGKGKGKGDAPQDWWCTEIGCEADSFNFSYRSHCAWCYTKKGTRAAADAKVKDDARGRDKSRNRDKSLGRDKSRGKSRDKSRDKSRQRASSAADDGFELSKAERKKNKNLKKKEEKRKRKEEKTTRLASTTSSTATDKAIVGPAAAAAPSAAADPEISQSNLKKMGPLATKTVPDFAGLFKWPHAPPTSPKTAEEQVAEAAACRSVDILSKTDGKIATYEKLKDAVMKDADADPEVIEEMKEKLVKMKKDRAAMAERGIGGSVMVDQLGSKKAQEKLRGTEREASWQAEREKMTRRAALLRQALAEDLANAQKKLSDFDGKFTECTESWTLEDNRKSDHHEKLMCEWDKRIREVSALAGPETTNATAATTAAAVPMETETFIGEKDYILEAIWVMADAPAVKIENETQKAFLGGLWCHLDRWHQLGRQLVMYKELVPTGAEGIASIQHLVGPGFWTKLYGNRAVGPEDVVPSQLKYVLKEILNKLAAKVVGDAEAKAKLEATAKATFELIQANGVAKRGRAA